MTVTAAILLVRMGRAARICQPGRWVVWRAEGQAKPRLRVLG